MSDYDYCKKHDCSFLMPELLMCPHCAIDRLRAGDVQEPLGDALIEAFEVAQKRIAELESRLAECEGTDPLAGDPSKWGHNAMIIGLGGQRDAAEAKLARAVALLSDVLRFAGTTNAGCGDAHRYYAKATAFLAEMKEGK